MEKMTIEKWKDISIKYISPISTGLMIGVIILLVTRKLDSSDSLKYKVERIEIEKLDRAEFKEHETKQDIQIRQIKEDRKQDLDQIEKLFNSRFDDFQKWYIKNNK